MIRRYILAFGLCLFGSAGSYAEESLWLQRVVDGIYVHVGPHEDGSAQNLGSVGNAGVVIGDQAVALIDTGGSRAFGEKLRTAVRGLTDLPIRYVINTHAHPDHIFGNAAFDDAATTFVGHRNHTRALTMRGPHYLASFERLLGPAFSGSRIVAPRLEVAGEIRIDLGGRTLLLTAWQTAHTDNDLTILDPTTNTLFAGDLVFIDRLPVVDGSLKGWLAVTEALRSIPAVRVVPGHGPAAAPWPDALDAQERYLRALAYGVRREIARGGSISAAIDSTAREEQGLWSRFEEDHPRNVTTSYTELEWE